MKSTPIVLTILTLLLLAPGVRAQDQTPEAYSGVAMGTGGSVGAKSIQFDFQMAFLGGMSPHGRL